MKRWRDALGFKATSRHLSSRLSWIGHRIDLSTVVHKGKVLELHFWIYVSLASVSLPRANNIIATGESPKSRCRFSSPPSPFLSSSQVDPVASVLF